MHEMTSGDKYKTHSLIAINYCFIHITLQFQHKSIYKHLH